MTGRSTWPMWPHVPVERAKPRPTDLEVARSRDGGRMWASVVLTGATSHVPVVAFQPQVAVDAAGTVAVSYLRLAQGRVAVLLAQSTARSLRFGAPRCITTRPFDPTLGLPGDKEGLWWIGGLSGPCRGTGAFPSLLGGHAHRPSADRERHRPHGGLESPGAPALACAAQPAVGRLAPMARATHTPGSGSSRRCGRSPGRSPASKRSKSSSPRTRSPGA